MIIPSFGDSHEAGALSYAPTKILERVRDSRPSLALRRRVAPTSVAWLDELGLKLALELQLGLGLGGKAARGSTGGGAPFYIYFSVKECRSCGHARERKLELQPGLQLELELEQELSVLAVTGLHLFCLNCFIFKECCSARNRALVLGFSSGGCARERVS